MGQASSMGTGAAFGNISCDGSHMMWSHRSQQGTVGHEIAQSLHLQCLHRRAHRCSHTWVNQDGFQELGS